MIRKNKITKFILVILILILLILGFTTFLKLNFTTGYRISIMNNSNEIVENLEIKYKSGNSIEKISRIDSKKHWKYTVDTSSISGEDAIVLNYKDNKANNYEEYLVGYIEKNYSGKIKVIIDKIYESGELDIIIK